MNTKDGIKVFQLDKGSVGNLELVKQLQDAVYESEQVYVKSYRVGGDPDFKVVMTAKGEDDYNLTIYRTHPSVDDGVSQRPCHKAYIDCESFEDVVGAIEHDLYDSITYGELKSVEPRENCKESYDTLMSALEEMDLPFGDDTFIRIGYIPTEKGFDSVVTADSDKVPVSFKSNGFDLANISNEIRWLYADKDNPVWQRAYELQNGSIPSVYKNGSKDFIEKSRQAELEDEDELDELFEDLEKKWGDDE